MGNLLIQLKKYIHIIQDYFFKSPISLIFLILIILILIFNVIKNILIWIEKKNNSIDQSCEFLVTGGTKQDCTHPSHRERFLSNGYDCTGCWGKSYKLSSSDAENRVIKSAKWKYFLVLIANSGSSILPYITFFYTLVIAVFNDNK